MHSIRLCTTACRRHFPELALKHVRLKNICRRVLQKGGDLWAATEDLEALGQRGVVGSIEDTFQNTNPMFACAPAHWQCSQGWSPVAWGQMLRFFKMALLTRQLLPWALQGWCWMPPRALHLKQVPWMPCPKSSPGLASSVPKSCDMPHAKEPKSKDGSQYNLFYKLKHENCGRRAMHYRAR